MVVPYKRTGKSDGKLSLLAPTLSLLEVSPSKKYEMFADLIVAEDLVSSSARWRGQIDDLTGDGSEDGADDCGRS